jgi:LmbE family N-acetylglucosaminyl deacetylase
MRSENGHFMSDIYRAMRTALIIGAHPDDAILGVGGTATLLKRSGWRVVILTATRGGMGGNESAREREELDSTSLLSFVLHQGNLPDGAFGLDPGIRLIDPLVKKYRPDMVFTHAPDDTHQDHRTLTQAAIIATRSSPFVLYYEGPSTQQFNPIVKVDITSVWNEKLAAIQVYRSQLERLDLIRWATSVACFRSWPESSRTYIEGFQPHRLSVDLVSKDSLIASPYYVSSTQVEDNRG